MREGVPGKIVRHAAKCRSTATRTNVITRNSSPRRHVRKLPPSVRGLRLRDRLTSPARDARCPHSLEPPWPPPPTLSRSARSPCSAPAQSVSSPRPHPSHTTQLTASPRFPRAPYRMCLVRLLPRSRDASVLGAQASRRWCGSSSRTSSRSRTTRPSRARTRRR